MTLQTGKVAALAAVGLFMRVSGAQSKKHLIVLHNFLHR